MKREYNCECTTGQPKVAYRETSSKQAKFSYTHKKQSGGAGQFGRVEGYIVPLDEPSKPAEFENEMIGSNIPPEFVPAIEKGFLEALGKGPLVGAPVMGVRIVLQDGAAHAVDSSEIAFRFAAQGAFKQAMRAGTPQILEPIMSTEVTVPSEYQGAAVAQIAQRKGLVQGMDGTDYVTITADVPLDNMFGYSNDLRGATQGKGEYAMEYKEHSPVPREKQEELVKAYAEKRAGKSEEE